MLKRTLATLVGVLALAGGTAAAASAHTYYVSKSGRDSNPCTKTKPCATIQHAVAKAHHGDSVLVHSGTYSGTVTISQDIRVAVTGRRDPVLDLRGAYANGFVISGRKAAGTEIKGFVVEGALQEGILARETSSVTISGNIVHHNDLGAFSSKPTGECAPSGEVPGDCGEAVHLMSVSYSTVTSNRIYGNSGGILLTDEAGPTAFNTISENRSNRNLYDCGITLASHNSNAVATSGKGGGVYDNTISGNTVNGNGTLGEGAGIIMATGVPGGGVWSNLIRDNIARRNGLAGVVIHAHTPGVDLNGNRIIANVLTHNGLADSSEAEFGENNGKQSVTNDILIGSDVVTLHGTVVKGNLLGSAHYGVFTKNDAKKVRRRRNFFRHVAVKVKQT